MGEISLASEADGLSWEAQQDRLWISLPNTEVGVADPATGQVIATYPIAIDVDQAQLKLDGGRLYLSDSIGMLHILDASTYKELASLSVPGEVTLDSAHHRLYAASWNSPEGSVTVVDTDALAVIKTITPGGSVGWDPTRDRLFVGRLDRGGEVYDTLTLEGLADMPVGGKVVYNPLRDELLIVAHTVFLADAETLAFIADLLPDIGGQACPQCEGALYASDIQVLVERNLLEITISHAGRGGGCGPSRRFVDATTLEPITDPASMWPRGPTCSRWRGLPEPLLDRVYEELWCGGYVSYRNLLVYDLQGNLLTWRDGLDTGVVNPNTCQAYLSQVEADRTLVLDLPSLTFAGTLRKAIYTVDAEAGRVYGLAGSELLVYAADGGQPEPTPPPTEAGPLPSGEIGWMGASPDFSQDRTLFVKLSSQGIDALYRSNDAGATWVRLRGGLPADGHLAVVISPDFGADHTLIAAGSSSMLGVLRSTDAGDTWQWMWEGLSHLAVDSVAVSPQYATDGTLLAYSTYHDLLHPTGSTPSVSRSTDRGLHWTLLQTGAAPPPEELLPPDPRSPDLRFRQGYWWGVDRWTSTLGSWQPVLRLPDSSGPARAVLPSPDINSDGTVYVLTEAGLFRSTDRGDTWAHCPDPRLRGADYAHQPTTGVWAGDQLLIATRQGELVFVDPAALRCEPIEVAAIWPTVLGGSYVVDTAAQPRRPSAVRPGPDVWLADQPNSRLYRYADGAIQAQYSPADGVPRFPNGLALTANGEVWVSGAELPGVASFDGQSWTPRPLPELPAAGQVLGIAAGPDGTVWAISEPPAVYRWSGEAWEVLADPQRELEGGIIGIAIGTDGSPWVATWHGLAHYERAAWTGYDLGECMAVAVGPGGEVYCLVTGGLVWRFTESVWSTLPLPGSDLGLQYTLYAAQDGAIWIGADLGAFRYDGEAWQHFTLESGLPGQKVLAMAEDAGGALWFGTDNGAARIDPLQVNLSPVCWPPPVPVALPTAAPSPTPWPTPAPTPRPGAIPVADRFAPIYADAWIAALLRFPREQAVLTPAAYQAFERGSMLWRADSNVIYVLHDDGTWAMYSDTWDESQPTYDPGRVPPAGLLQPVRGFGRLWRTEVGLALRIGWALSAEQGYEMLAQAFVGGTLLEGPQGEAYILLPFWTWQRRLQ